MSPFRRLHADDILQVSQVQSGRALQDLESLIQRSESMSSELAVDAILGTRCSSAMVGTATWSFWSITDSCCQRTRMTKRLCLQTFGQWRLTLQRTRDSSFTQVRHRLL